MSERTFHLAWIFIVAACVIAVCLIWHSCGTTAEIVCPNGGSAKVESRGSFDSGSEAGICEELEGGKDNE